MRWSNCCKLLTVGLALELLCVNLPGISRRATLAGESPLTRQPVVFEENFEPPGEGYPDDTAGAGSRDGVRCAASEPAMRAIVPPRNYGLTLEEHPRVFVYMPETTAQQVLLAFKDESGDYYQRALLPIAEVADIVSFRLPEDAPPLSVGKNYQWVLTVICGTTPTPDDPVFSGWVQRVEQTAEVEKGLAGKPAEEQAQWYGERGYWYDLVASLVQARQTHPEDARIHAQWESLLELAGLSAIADERRSG